MDYSLMDTADLIGAVRCYCGNVIDLRASGRSDLADKWMDCLSRVLGVINNRAGARDLMLHRLQGRKDYVDLLKINAENRIRRA
jgi:hypothetical protein